MVGTRKSKVVKKVLKKPTKDSGTKHGPEEKYVVEKVIDKRFVNIVFKL